MSTHADAKKRLRDAHAVEEGLKQRQAGEHVHVSTGNHAETRQVLKDIDKQGNKLDKAQMAAGIADDNQARLAGKGGEFNGAPRKGVLASGGLATNKVAKGQQGSDRAGKQFLRYFSGKNEYHVYLDPDTGKKQVFRVNPKGDVAGAVEKEAGDKTAQGAALDYLAQARATQIDKSGKQPVGLLKASKNPGDEALRQKIIARLDLLKKKKKATASTGGGASTSSSTTAPSAATSLIAGSTA